MNLIDTAGKLRHCTTKARAIDPVEVVVYIPGVREPVTGYIAGHIVKNPTDDPADPSRVLILQVMASPTEPVKTPAEPVQA